MTTNTAQHTVTLINKIRIFIHPPRRNDSPFTTMTIGRIHSNKKLFAQLLLLGTPTVLLAFYVLRLANQYYIPLGNDYSNQALFFSGGLAASLIFYAFRFRFITTAAVLVGVLYAGYKIIGNVSLGEFDAFFVSIKFFLFAFLFSLGWFVGFGFSRARYFTIGWSVFLLAAMILIVSRVAEVRAETIILAFAPTLAYSFYIIYMSELIRNMNEDEPSFVWYIFKRFAAFAVVAAALIFGLLFYLDDEFKGVEREFGGGGKGKPQTEGGNKLTKQDGSGVSTQNQMGLTGNNQNDKNKQKRLLFVSKLDNFFNDGKTPNPLYYVTDYFDKFDTETQTFEIDSTAPYRDLFSPDPSKTPLYFTKTDTSVLRKMMASKMRKVVNAEIYKTLLSSHSFTAPATAYFMQPISVPPEDSGKFRSAYRAKMNVSALNSAYFVYNPVGEGAAQLKTFQEERFKELRTVQTYTGMPQNFMQYYTSMPNGAEYDSIRTLARQIVAKSGAKTFVDQIIAIRDHFTALDENGLPTFYYTDNPGVPGMPSASKLTYFLFQNKKGYCAYYAGATLFLLRALGIPSRVATGFLTVDRSAKNPGWYFFYEDQAHAWVQAYFPGYGWIDFDTTVPNREQQQAPQPDETPPLSVQQAFLVANGKVESVDVEKKTVRMVMDKMVYWDDPYELPHNVPLTLDVKIARFIKDTGTATIADVKPGTEIVAVSYAEAFKKLPPHEDDNVDKIISRFPNPAPIDEIKIMSSEEAKKDDRAQPEKEGPPFNWKRAFWIGLCAVAFLAILFLSLPWLVFQYLHAKAKGKNGSLKQQAYNRFLASTYYLNQVGYHREEKTSLQFAKDVVDPTFKTALMPFMNSYLKSKYSTQPLDANDEKVIHAFYPKIIDQVKSQIAPGTRIARFTNIYRMVRYFVKPKLK